MSMTIDKAIEINQSLLDGEYDHRDATMEDALKLGIEAMKEIKWARVGRPETEIHLLPGETKD